MKSRIDLFRYDPLQPLIESGDPAVSLFARKDLLDEKLQVKTLWELPSAQRILRRQNKNGSWTYPGGNKLVRSKENYNQLETYRNLGYLVEQFGFTKKHPAIEGAADYFFRFKSSAVDFRGIYGNQYSPNYTATITELLVKAGYANDARIKKVFDWLLSIRQQDGGWAIPFRTKKLNLEIL